MIGLDRAGLNNDEIAALRAAFRRLYRSGVSEYLINRKPVRLKDVRELFMDTGMGSHAYSVIEQGRVDAKFGGTRLDDSAHVLELQSLPVIEWVELLDRCLVNGRGRDQLQQNSFVSGQGHRVNVLMIGGCPKRGAAFRGILPEPVGA